MADSERGHGATKALEGKSLLAAGAFPRAASFFGPSISGKIGTLQARWVRRMSSHAPDAPHSLAEDWLIAMGVSFLSRLDRLRQKHRADRVHEAADRSLTDCAQCRTTPLVSDCMAAPGGISSRRFPRGEVPFAGSLEVALRGEYPIFQLRVRGEDSIIVCQRIFVPWVCSAAIGGNIGLKDRLTPCKGSWGAPASLRYKYRRYGLAKNPDRLEQDSRFWDEERKKNPTADRSAPTDT